MRKEEDCKARERFLFTDELMSDELVNGIKAALVRTDKGKNTHNAQAYEKFKTWTRSEKEVCLFTLYAYADLKLPKPFDCIFRLDNPSDVIYTKFQLTQSLYEGKYPSETIENGHKHLCVFEFETEMPSILHELYVGSKFYDSPPNGALKLGICQSTDFEEIKSRQDYILRLKNEYGMEWWKFDRDAL
jgi:hypothetical protein